MQFLVGDVQGCAGPLRQLLRETGFSASRDRLVVLGDLVNRGPESLGVLQLLSSLGDAATCLLGNHDLHLLAVAHGARHMNKGDTFTDVLNDPAAPHWLEWLRQQKLAHLEAGWLCVHAGVVPQWDAAQTLGLADEVHAVLRGPGLAGFLSQMYGDGPIRWDESLAGAARLRFVVNTLTRIRFCSADGALDFKTKEGAGAALPGYQPWFELTGRRTAAQRMAFGHWSTLGLLQRPTLLALDTGCVWGAALTAARVDGGRQEIHQVPCARSQVPGLQAGAVRTSAAP